MTKPHLDHASAVVTGHTRGLGAGIAAHLLARDIQVLGIARKTNPDLAKRHGDSLHEVQLDLADSAAHSRWLGSDTLRRFLDGRTTVLLANNAGVLQPIGPLETQDVTAVSRAVAVNIAAPLMLSAAFITASAQATDRRILHISSGAGRKGYAGWSVYCASKAALDNHARSVELDRTPALRISSVAPGVIDTDMQAEIRASTEGLFPDRQRFIEMHREGTLLSPAQTAGALVDFLLSDAFGSEPVSDLRQPR